MAEPVKTLENCVNNDFNPCFTENATSIKISKAAFWTRRNEQYCIGHTLDKNTNMIEVGFFLKPIIHIFRTLFVISFNPRNSWKIESILVSGIECPREYTFNITKTSNTNISVNSDEMCATIKSTNNVSAHDNVCFTSNAKYITFESTCYEEKTCIGATFEENTSNVELKFYIVPIHPIAYLLTAKRFNTNRNINIWFESEVTRPNTREIISYNRNGLKDDITLAFIPKSEVPTYIKIKLSLLTLNVQNKSAKEYSEFHKTKILNCFINNLPMDTVNVESNDGGNYIVHKDILMANSDVFKTMFDCNMHEANNKTLRIEELNTIQLKSFIKYLLTGDIHCIAEADLVEMLNLAEKYNMPDLKQWIQSRLWDSVELENCIEMYRNATMFQLTLLERRVEDMLGSEQFFKSEHFKNIKDIELLHKCVEMRFKCGELY